MILSHDQHILHVYEQAAKSPSLTDWQFRQLVLGSVNLEDASPSDLVRTVELAVYIGWPRALQNATWAQPSLKRWRERLARGEMPREQLRLLR